VLTLRAPHLPYHADQVSLPGGRLEADESAEEAALREAHEEVGVAPGLVRVLGRLTPLHIPVSGFTLQAVVGVATSTPTFTPEPGEVAGVLEVAIGDLVRPGVLGHAPWFREIRELDVPYFDVAGDKVWGATAMILSELLTLLGIEIDPWAGDSPVPARPTGDEAGS
jgi:8-oxo-dGTP pyrophosphatase MutT (NUDIX family)